MPRSLVAGLLLVGLGLFAWPRPAGAIPVFAHRFNLQCQACHSVVPNLTPFGEEFRANGYRIGTLKPRPVFPVAIKLQGEYSSAPADPAAPLPKFIVDEIELLSAGTIGARGAYFVEIYALDGGFPGRAREVWAGTRLSAGGARFPVNVRAGQFSLPLPLDPESFRETTDHYAIWDQTGGANGFTFFEPKMGLQLTAGRTNTGLSFTLNALHGHDAGGNPALGVDTMVSVQQVLGPWSVSAYRYDGSRTVATLVDRFWRTGYGLAWQSGATRVDAVYQTGNDSVADALAGAVQTSGGFVQVRQTLGPLAFAIARWDATGEAGFMRSFIAGFGYRPARNSRVTIWDTMTRNPITGGTQHTVSSSVLKAY
jgi:hypothetical protein